MRLALRLGAILAGADYLQMGALSRFAEFLGDACRFSDDLFDFDEEAKAQKTAPQTTFGRRRAFVCEL